MFTSPSARSDPSVFKVRIVLAHCTIKGIYDATIQTNERVLVLSGVGRSKAEGWNLVNSLSIPIYKSFRNYALPTPLNARTYNEP